MWGASSKASTGAWELLCKDGMATTALQAEAPREVQGEHKEGHEG